MAGVLLMESFPLKTLNQSWTLKRLSFWFVNSLTIVLTNMSLSCFLVLQLSSKIALRTVDLNDPVENKTFSSAFSYHLLLEDKSDLPSNLSQLNFRWLGLNSCQSRFVCGKLNGNSAIKVVDDAGAKEIWVKGELYEGQMNPESTFQVHVKRTGDDMSLSCFFWCTPDGQIPEAVNGEDVADIDELVNSSVTKDCAMI